MRLMAFVDVLLSPLGFGLLVALIAWLGRRRLPRTLLAFRAAGFEPCAYAGDYRAAPLEGPADFLPSAGAIANADAVLHEWVGEIAYRIRAAF